jgi:hypothetical protein
MEVIKIKGTDDTPNVILGRRKQYYRIFGKIIPEDVVRFMLRFYNGLKSMPKAPMKKLRLSSD